MQYDKDLKSEHRHLFLKVRELLLKDKEVSELKKERITTYFFAAQACATLGQCQMGLILVS